MLKNVEKSIVSRRHDTHHNGIQHNDTQHNDTQHKGPIVDIQHNDTKLNDTQHSNTLPLCSMSLWWMSRFIYCYAECHSAECRYAECHYAECRYAECRGALFFRRQKASSLKTQDKIALLNRACKLTFYQLQPLTRVKGID